MVHYFAAVAQGNVSSPNDSGSLIDSMTVIGPETSKIENRDT